MESVASMDATHGLDLDALHTAVEAMVIHRQDEREFLFSRAAALLQLEALGLVAEQDAHLAEDLATMALDGSTEAVICLVDAAVGERLALIERSVAAAVADPALLRTLPIFASDPARSQELQQDLAQALWARESLHRLSLALTAVRGERLDSKGLAAVDEGLRQVVPCLSRLAAMRSAACFDLPEQTREAHWWFADAADDDVKADELEFSAVLLPAELEAWVAHRVQRGDHGVVLRLMAAEHAQLASTDLGLAFIDEYTDWIDVAAEPLPPLLVDARAGARGWLSGLEVKLREFAEWARDLIPPTLQPAYALAATGGGGPLTPGHDDVEVAWVGHAVVEPRVGVLALAAVSRPSPDGDRWVEFGAWVLPHRGVHTIRRSGEPAWSAAHATTEGLVWLLQSELPLDVEFELFGPEFEEPELVQIHFGSIATTATPDDPVTLALRLATQAGRAEAQELWTEARSVLGAASRRATSGLDDLLHLSVANDG